MQAPANGCVSGGGRCILRGGICRGGSFSGDTSLCSGALRCCMPGGGEEEVGGEEEEEGGAQGPVGEEGGMSPLF